AERCMPGSGRRGWKRPLRYLNRLNAPTSYFHGKGGLHLRRTRLRCHLLRAADRSVQHAARPAGPLERARRPAPGPGGLGTVIPKAAQIVVTAAGRSQNAYRRCVPARRRPTDGPERAGIATLRQKCSAGGPIALGPENRSGPEFTCSLARTGGLNELARARQWAETRHRPRPSVRPCRRPLPRARQGRGSPSSTGHPAGEDCANRCPR
ncbi:hypothetical protein GGP85_003312, partial [Salinibacter ruber]|nr:hypothetical protein [Salinibacter ruber]MCS3827841.1 hypothetical protein [Salinibacter ruber]MCS4145775.1 hypothetical protein [Salinibacter ruber]